MQFKPSDLVRCGSGERKRFLSNIGEIKSLDLTSPPLNIRTFQKRDVVGGLIEGSLMGILMYICLAQSLQLPNKA
ncbi:hypothetical protein F2Q69_00035670 [Brassica cretica]|uniref:Uncharacterized protein n=1 Tax=Brassica cretica TaxID=69181 RepID=A0A8S9SDN6_BRACR|nr:hypothetical protein F2Q69_00035670 [Brassica cretica]